MYSKYLVKLHELHQVKAQTHKRQLESVISQETLMKVWIFLTLCLTVGK